MNSITIQEIIDYLKRNNFDFSFKGDERTRINGFSSLTNYKEGTLTWVKKPDSFVLDGLQLNIELVVTEKNCGLPFKNIIEASNSKEVFFSILDYFWGGRKHVGIAPSAVIETQKIGSNVSVGHHSYICEDVVIHDNVQIGNQVSIECPCVIGEGSIIGSGVVIGTDGFGYFQDANQIYKRVKHFGGVKIGRNVEVGANTCIDRGTIEDTCIGDNVKIDNLCHIAHNVRIGENSLVIALSLLGGSTILDKNVYVAPGCMIKNQLHLGKDAFVGMGSVVLSDVPENKVVVGVPAKILRDNKRG
ncbi:MAG: hypothetical protein E7293_04520 [Lachnospiraceae bacterium]|nr:hypothetical protein [Lachnospiraceae bacterium]